MGFPVKFSRVLVISGSTVFRELLRLILGSHAQEVLLAQGRHQAIGFLSRVSPVDVIVCNVSLPDGDGFQILDDVAMLAEGRPEMILVTGRPDAEEARRAMEMGAVGYLANPISFRDIVGALKQSRYGVALRAPRRRPGGRASLIGLEGEFELAGPDDPQLLWYARDVSATGAFIETESPLPVGSKLDLALDIGDVRIRVTAEVVRVQEPEWGQGAGIGVSFVEFGDSAREALQGYVNAGGSDTY